MTAQSFMESFQHAERVVATINRLVWRRDMAFPTGGNHLQGGCRKIWVPHALLLMQEGERFEDGFSRLVTLKLDGAEQRREKAPYCGIACDDLLVVVVISRTCHLVNSRHGLRNLRLLFSGVAPLSRSRRTWKLIR